MRATRAVAGSMALLTSLATSTAAMGQTAGSVPTVLSQPKVRAALAAARQSEPRTIEDQIRFCEVPAPPFEEGARADVLKRVFQDLGLRNVRTDRVGNVLGDRPGQRPSPRLVVASHLDTVFPPDTMVRVTREGDRVFRGPGIGDNCRGLAVLAAIVRSLRDAGVETAGPVTFVANVGEEGLGDLRGVKALFGETLKGQVDRFVSIDGPGIYVSNVGVGSYRYRVTFHGPGGHSFGAFGLPNPANALGRAVARIAEIRVPSVPHTTFNVGRIGGGTSVNAIPADAWMEIDMRSSDPAQLKAVDAKVKAAIEAGVQDENRRWPSRERITAATQLVGDRPAGALPATAPIVQTALAAAQALFGVAPLLGEGSTDSNLPLSLGIPAVTIGGGGVGDGAHAANESWTSTDSWKGTQHALLLTIALANP